MESKRRIELLIQLYVREVFSEEVTFELRPET